MHDYRSLAGAGRDIAQLAKATLPRLCIVSLDTYERSEADRPILSDSEEIDRVLLDPTGELPRMRRSDYEETDFDEATEGLPRLHITLTAHPKQAEFIRSVLRGDSKVNAVLSGSRAGKTYAMAQVAVALWVMIGGPGVAIAWGAPSRKQTRFAVNALCIGAPGSPPILPKEIVSYFPKSEMSSEQAIILSDGFRIDLHHCSGDGDNWRGNKYWGVLLDEITGYQRSENYSIALNRLGETGGPMVIGSTPKQNHWAKQMIYDREGSEIQLHSFSCYDNPWFPLKEIDRLIESMGGEDDPLVKREVFGEWVTDGVACFPQWDPGLHTRTEDTRTLDALGLQDITKQACSAYWRVPGDCKLLGGQDFNERSHTTVVCGVGVRPGSDPGDWHNWILVALAEYQTGGYVEDHAVNLTKHLAEDFGSGPIPLAADASDAVRDYSSHTGLTNKSQSNSKILQSYGYEVKAPMYKRTSGRSVPHNPYQADSVNLINWLFRRGQIIVHSRCALLRRGLSELERDHRGGIAKVSAPGSITDIISDPVDALRYAVEPIFGKRWRLELRKLDD